MGVMKDAGSLSIPRSAIKAWWPEGSDSGFDSWRSLALAAQLAHPRSPPRGATSSSVAAGAHPTGRALQQEVVAFLEDPSDRSSGCGGGRRAGPRLRSEVAQVIRQTDGEEKEKKEEEEDDATRTAREPMCGLVRSAVSLRLHVGGAVVEAPILIHESRSFISTSFCRCCSTVGGWLAGASGHRGDGGDTHSTPLAFQIPQFHAAPDRTPDDGGRREQVALVFHVVI